MQNAKDTFYEVLRGRLAAINPSRTIVVRGVVRPGSLVEENEMAVAAVTPDCFRLHWTKMTVDAQGVLPLVMLACEVEYETAGTTLGGGLDRGRCMAAMDAEILTAVTATHMRSTKVNYAALAHAGEPASVGTAIWWGEPVFSPAETRGERLRRTAAVEVFSYQEAGEL